MRSKFITLLLIAFIPSTVFANGGDQRVIENRYLISLSRAPFTPVAGTKVSFLPSFVDLKTGELISEDLIVRIRIAKLGGPDKREFLFEKDNVRVKGGILENFAYTFKAPGLHEIFFDFALASNPEEIHETPDFLIDVRASAENINQLKGWVVGGTLLGLLIGLFVGQKLSAKKPST